MFVETYQQVELFRYYNALLINNDIPQNERIVKLRELAISELKVLEKLNTEKLYLIEDKNEKE